MLVAALNHINLRQEPLGKSAQTHHEEEETLPFYHHPLRGEEHAQKWGYNMKMQLKTILLIIGKTQINNVVLKNRSVLFAFDVRLYFHYVFENQ